MSHRSLLQTVVESQLLNAGVAQQGKRRTSQESRSAVSEKLEARHDIPECLGDGLGEGVKLDFIEQPPLGNPRQVGTDFSAKEWEMLDREA